MTTTEMQTKLYEAANYADAISTIANAHDDDAAYSLLADKCSEIICEIADLLTTTKGETK